MFKLVFFVPKVEAEDVKNALFNLGVGRLGNYSHCSFEVEGIGQFKPSIGANPTLGNVGTVEKVVELRVEMLCSPELIKEAVDVLNKVHPYEEVAYEIYQIIRV